MLAQAKIIGLQIMKTIIQYGKVVTALGKKIRLMCKVDGVIESAGGWPGEVMKVLKLKRCHTLTPYT